MCHAKRNAIKFSFVNISAGENVAKLVWNALYRAHINAALSKKSLNAQN